MAGYKYIVLYHSPLFKTFEDMEAYDRSYRSLDGHKLSLKEAFIRRREGEKIIFPKSTVRYHYVIAPYNNDYTIHTGRHLDKKAVHSSIRRVNNESLSVCFLGDFDKVRPSVKMLQTGGVLIRSLMQAENISANHVVPERYFNKKDTHPGLLFNVKRFVKEFIL